VGRTWRVAPAAAAASASEHPERAHLGAQPRAFPRCLPQVLNILSVHTLALSPMVHMLPLRYEIPLTLVTALVHAWWQQPSMVALLQCEWRLPVMRRPGRQQRLSASPTPPLHARRPGPPMAHSAERGTLPGSRPPCRCHRLTPGRRRHPPPPPPRTRLRQPITPQRTYLTQPPCPRLFHAAGQPNMPQALQLHGFLDSCAAWLLYILTGARPHNPVGGMHPSAARQSPHPWRTAPRAAHACILHTMHGP